MQDSNLTTLDTLESLVNMRFQVLTTVWSFPIGPDPPLINDYKWLKEQFDANTRIIR